MKHSAYTGVDNHESHVHLIHNAFMFWRSFTQHVMATGLAVKDQPFDPRAMVPDDCLVCAQKHHQGLLQRFSRDPGVFADFVAISINEPPQYISAGLPTFCEIPEGYPYDPAV